MSFEIQLKDMILDIQVERGSLIQELVDLVREHARMNNSADHQLIVGLKTVSSQEILDYWLSFEDKPVEPLERVYTLDVIYSEKVTNI